MELSRREAIKLGLTGIGGLLIPFELTDSALAETSSDCSNCLRSEIGSPTFNQEELSHQIIPFQRPFQRPPLLQPVRSYEKRRRPLDCYEITMKKAQVEIIPGLNTEVWSYNGTLPGPVIRQRGGFRDEDRGRDSLVRCINQLGTTQENGREIPINTSIHLHGMASLPQYDGYAEDLICPKQFKDYFYPNDRAATIWYHDHAIDRTSRNVYMGLAGMYIVEDEEERQFNLPKGEYDVPLILQDLRLADDGSLIFNDRGQRSLYGDVSLVNGVPWPYMKVARRKYRFRVLNASTSRLYQLVLSQKENRLTTGEKLAVIGTDCGLLDTPVELASPLQTLSIAPAERYEFVIDFARYPLGTQLFLRNPEIQNTSNIDSDDRLQTIMRFDIDRDEPDDSSLPDRLRPIKRLDPNQAVRTRKFRFERTSTKWLINNKSWNKDRVDANPQPGDIEIWELTNNGGWMHPVHIHFVDWQILDRNGRPPLAYERGWKDVFQIDHFETVRVIAEFGRRSGDYLQGKFMMHCHNLVHEDHSMMTQFEVGENGLSPCSEGALPLSEIRPL
ncbi:MAG: multicopper oxidase family protein [Xenococcaceae cyanobacterium MO_188.B29]|nr:multicopper oxidase family protein [Xenococcaceae cyanobacterium MO_188.B29]